MDSSEEEDFVRTRGESVTTVPGTWVVVLAARAEPWLDDAVGAKLPDIVAPAEAWAVVAVAVATVALDGVVVCESFWATGNAQTLVIPLDTRRQTSR